MRGIHRHRRHDRHHRATGAEHHHRTDAKAGMEHHAGGGAGGEHGARSPMWLAHAILHGGIIDGRYQPPANRIRQYVPPTLPATVAPGSPIVINIRNVGYLRQVVLEFTLTVTGGGTTTSTRTAMGLANMFSNVTLQDYAGNRRINCDGWYLVYLAASKRGWLEGAAVTNDSPLGLGNNNPGTISATQWAGWNCPATIGANSSAVVTGIMVIPLSPDVGDLRGLLDAQVTEVVTTVSLTVNPNFSVVAGADATFAVFQSGGTDLATISNFALTPYQDYFYDLPKSKDGAELVPLDEIAQAYYLETVPFAVLNNNVDNYYQFVNRRRFLSTLAIFDNGGTLNFGTDVNYFKILSASQTPLLQVDPHIQQYDQRLYFGTDLPKGMYFFNHRGAPMEMVPIDTRIYGNMQWVIQPNTLNSGASVRLGFEQLVNLGDVRQGPSLASR